MRLAAVSLGLGLVSLAGCASSGAASFGPTQIMGGDNGDLRVFVNRRCTEAVQLEELRQKYVRPDSRFQGLAVDMLAQVGALAFKSFGSFLHKAGEASFTQSLGSTGGYFYAASRPGESGASRNLSPEMRCIYVVRDGFALQPSRFAASAPEDLQKVWGELGLNKTPDLFAILHLETTSDAELMSLLPQYLDYVASAGEGAGPLQLSPTAPYYRAKLDRLFVREFQETQSASSYRDIAIVLNYDLPASGAKFGADAGDRGTADMGRGGPGILAAGGIRLPGVEKGDYRADVLAGLQTGWMRMPALRQQGEDNPRGAIDLSVYVVESAPGNPFLQSVGDYLSGETVVSNVAGALQNELKD
jgi:hypothetical protein